MNISLEEINSSNYEMVCDLDVTKEQDEYVASNMWSLVESHYSQGHTCRAIYKDSEPVGFIMWVLENPSKVSIWRLMVDKSYQNEGIGRKALALALDEIKSYKDLKENRDLLQPEESSRKRFLFKFWFSRGGAR